ncbi:Non-repetitive/WGA-negative nucleoporin C-terminal-domain-containing protein [Neohortaea acidophila]|uniref:Non-repetitive/WGA-negative nucleoporin C-terminal-domain-containing protein n=1 Tax=Neohortaea acidophila TaxID=245834 RepID=A0A6A6Q0M2_9PEZI|nr:Non-repetitive/WGA-negative nucleoporin C-terminal-domain-containing protein [Neohortaea acidophila]KAF2484967.1 Non-repetitive/WGA-negative nucleoporin C-terminal-domain-containing protein [Neohortaea acidophila]
MAAVAGPATPQRPLPGAYTATPAPPPTIFAANAASLRQNTQPQQTDTSTTTTSNNTQTITSVERAARTINDALAQEARFPELESYITQGISGEYDMPSTPAWMPFQKLKQYDIPPKLLEQVNHTGVGVLMGIFAPLGHAWIALDNCLYLWDYTLPNPDIVGWEENVHPITAIKLVKPKPGVFVKEIEHLIVVVTSADMTLLGVATDTTETGARTVALYSTRMSINVRGLGVDFVEASNKSGRIFFVGSQSDDIYEFQYQQDEGWFRGRTSRICHTKTQFAFVQGNISAVGQYFGPQRTRRLVRQLVIDDSRGLMFSLSNNSEITVYIIKAHDLQECFMRPKSSLLQNTGHFSPRTDLLDEKKIKFVSISGLPSSETSRVSLMATTDNGCRLYLSVTHRYGYPADERNAPTSMQILHVRFPPRDPSSIPQTQTPQQQPQTAFGTPASNVDTTSRLLTVTETAYRFPPGYFLSFIQDATRPDRHRVFCSAPDSARLKNPQDNTQLNQRFAEFAMLMDLPGLLQQVAPITATSGATTTPLGFGNELAEQFGKDSTEIAIVTSTAIQTIRRRRLVDIFAAIMRYGSADDEGREGDVKRFIRLYGRTETAASALAVACGQGKDVTSDSRLNGVSDPQIIEGARRVFIEHGGKPETNANALTENSGSQLDNVRPSPRHEGMVLYVSRLVRDIWRATVVREEALPGEGPKLQPNVQPNTLKSVQEALNALSDFLQRNKTFIEGLAGPQAASRITNRQDEIAMQGEHRAMHSLVELVSSIIEGISFVLVLFDESVHDIINTLGEESRGRAKTLTFEALFVTAAGRNLAKELVKAIVNRNIANGSNVDTVADALRRRCGSFCSADDVVIFKAQEQVKRASEAGSQSETGRVLLNESQRLFQKVAASLSMEHLHWAIEQYVQMAFYAGAIQLCLIVAGERDRGRRALAWLKDGKPEGDARKEAFDARKQCYELVFATIQELDKETAASPETMDGKNTIAAKRRNEAYDVVNSSEDTVFQTCLYDWYVSIDQADRLLDVDSQNVVEYLKRRSQEDRNHADLLWRYYAHHNDFLQAASVQLDLARGFFDLTLEERIEYLSRARTNASTRQTALMDSRQSKQQLLREISDLLDVANIQDDILQRMKSDPRLSGDRRSQVLRSLNGPVLPVDELFNQYADQASYWDICLVIYQVADHRNPADIKASWQSLIDQIDDQARAQFGKQALAWESVGEKVRELGRRLNVNDATFPIQTLVPMLERYFIEPRENKPPLTWVPDLFLDLDIPHETLLPVMEQMYYGNEHPFTGAKRKLLAAQMVYLLQRWVKDSERKGERVPCGSAENASVVADAAASLMRSGDLDAETKKTAESLTSIVQRALR